MKERMGWDEYWIGVAEAVSARSDCERSKVGAVVVKDRRIRSAGYNGAPAGQPGCDTCPRRVSAASPGVSNYDQGETACVAIHAEANALLHCDREDLYGATLYVTREPCYACDKLIQGAGVHAVVWPKPEYCNGCGMPHTGVCSRKAAAVHAKASSNLSWEGLKQPRPAEKLGLTGDGA